MKRLSGPGGKIFIGVVLWLTVYPVVTSLGVGYAKHLGWPEIIWFPLIWLAFSFIPNPFWLSGIPAIILTTLLARRASQHPAFLKCPMGLVVAMSSAAGALSGAFIMTPLAVLGVLQKVKEPSLPFLLAGAAGGAITLTVITLIHRLPPPRTGPR